MSGSCEEEKALKDLYLAILLFLLERTRLRLSEVAEKLHVSVDELKRALEIREAIGKRFINVEEAEGEIIVSLREDAKDLYFQYSIAFILREPEKVKGGNDLFRRLLSVKSGEKAVFVHQLDDGKLIVLESWRDNGSAIFRAFLPVRLFEDLTFRRDKSGQFGIGFVLDSEDYHTRRFYRELEIKDRLLGIADSWSLDGFYILEERKDFIKKVLDSGGFITLKIKGEEER